MTVNRRNGVRNFNADHRLALRKLKEIKKNDKAYELYQEYEGIKPPIKSEHDRGIKMLPLKGYVFDWSTYKGETDKLERFLVPDTSYLGVMQYYKDSLLGFTGFYKKEGKWKWDTFRRFKGTNTKSPFFMTYFTCKDSANEVFTIRTYSFRTFYFWGYLKQGKLNIMKFYYGQIVHYSDFDKWAIKMARTLKDIKKN